jgi:hypothetical protein
LPFRILFEIYVNEKQTVDEDNIHIHPFKFVTSDTEREHVSFFRTGRSAALLHLEIYVTGDDRRRSESQELF